MSSVSAKLPDARYRAFLAYSHRDSDLAAWFHRKLEAWPIARDLVGRETRWGRVPKSLRPVFRDRDDFSGGASLAAATQTALEASAFMVVLCSPNAVTSAYVNEEVRRFKLLGRGDRIIPVIVAGEPGDSERECFPPAVAYVVDEDGRITKQRAEPVAPDMRDEGDGRERAAAKVVAGLIGVGFDEIVKRAERAERRRKALITGVAVVMTALAALAGGLAIYAQRQRNEAIQNFEIAFEAAETLIYDIAVDLRSVEGVRVVALRKILGRAQAAYEQLAARKPGDARFREGRVAMLNEFYLTYMAKYDYVSGRAAVEEMVELTGKLLAEERDDHERRHGHAQSLINLGDIARVQGDFAEAETALAQAVDLLEPLVAKRPGELVVRSLMSALRQTSLLRRELGDHDGAVVAADRVLALAAAGAAERPDDGEALTWHGVAQAGRAALAADAGALQDALAGLSRAVEILRRAAELASYTDNQTREVLAEAQTLRGQLLALMDRPKEAFTALQSAMFANLPLAQADPDNLTYREREAQLYTLMGEMESQLGEHERARASLQQAKERWTMLVMIQLGDPEPQMAEIELMLAIGRAAWRRGDREALEIFRAAWSRARGIAEKHGDLPRAHASAAGAARVFADYAGVADPAQARDILKAAIAAIESALTRLPEEPSLLELRADLERRLN